MGVFASYVWFWSIIGLLGLILLSTLGALLNMVGFLAPIKRSTRWLDSSPAPVQVGLVLFLLSLVAYPSLIHHLWAEATAEQTRRAFEALPYFPNARAEAPVEQMGGLFDPTGTDGTYIITTYGTAADFEAVRTFYTEALPPAGWVAQTTPARDRRTASQGRLVFRDHRDAEQAKYELVVVRLPVGTREVAQDLAGEQTLFSVRLGVVDPRATTQVAWFIDCLIRWAPTFPTCEPAGWHYSERPPGL